jgi:hypothetical protein
MSRRTEEVLETAAATTGAYLRFLKESVRQFRKTDDRGDDAQGVRADRPAANANARKRSRYGSTLQPSAARLLVSMPLLFYWRYKHYVADLDDGAAYHLNSTRAVLHEVDRGDSVWAITRRPDGAYVVAAELVVHATTHNRPDFQYGSYRVWGHLERSRYFDVHAQGDQEGVIRALSPPTTADALYHSFMGPGSVRRLTPEDHQWLTAATDDVPVEDRAELLPEAALETVVYGGNEDAVQSLVRDTPHGLSEDRTRTITREVPARNRALVERLQATYDGRCQICRWDPRDTYSASLCEGHHIQWLSRGGTDALDNLMLVCPNHHRAIHACDAPLDWQAMTLDFGEQEEALALEGHLAEESR